MRKAVFTAMEIRGEAAILHGMHRGELEARVLAGERAQASAPPDVSGTLRLTAQAEADALQQSADAEIQHDETSEATAKALAAQLAAERQRLEAGNARYETWSAGTRDTRETAGKAKVELQRRGRAQPEEEPQTQPGDQPRTTARRWREFEADFQAAERQRPPAPGRHRRRGTLAATAHTRAQPLIRTRAGCRAGSQGQPGR